MTLVLYATLSVTDLPRFCRNKPHVASPEPSRDELFLLFFEYTADGCVLEMKGLGI